MSNLVVYRYILQKSGLSEVASLKERVHASSGGSTEDLARKYYSSLSIEEFEGLKAWYKNDLEAFGYDAQMFHPEVVRTVKKGELGGK